MDSELDQLNWWDEQSCAEFEAFLDEMYWESQQDRLEDEAREWEERMAYNEGHVVGLGEF